MTVCALGALGNSVGKLRATSRPANATPTISVCAHAICPTPCLCHAEIGLCNPCFRINRTLRPPTTPRSTLFRRLARTHLSSDAVKRFAFASVQPEFHAPHACAMTFTTRAITGVMYQTVRFPPTLTMQLFFRLSVTGKSRGPDVPARGWFPSHDRNFGQHERKHYVSSIRQTLERRRGPGHRRVRRDVGRHSRDRRGDGPVGWLQREQRLLERGQLHPVGSPHRHDARLLHSSRGDAKGGEAFPASVFPSLRALHRHFQCYNCPLCRTVRFPLRTTCPP